ncbi:ABC transporter permease [Celeribacter marinus]|uniref:Pyrimidine ABC transporter, transmembrane component 1 n=1 Tax=Celeribacter marinus TaxID=1397108 RepID=A0A0N9ZKC6_9RHOB|nr:ABC transporter permease [Celeribacter marinus]ALI56127.1 pyrimidine ABC transporter, transmembrane component 1 [Celeribacter marinus]SFK86956.1 NitT/TauT family transport system permease protein [Celeribacter marinus]
MRRADTQVERIAYPAGFGLLVLLLWEIAVRVFEISPALLPPPTAIGAAIMGSLPILWEDWVQTVVKGALNGLWMGSAAGIAVALVIDRYDFLKRGLLPVANFMAALPIVGLAPIMVMWFGFDWQSKAAVVAIMVFFPMLVNTLGGLASTDTMQRDLMRTYAAGHVATLVKLRIPAALPFVFNGLKIATTLALIGAIVAEYFGSPIRGMGFRITTEMGRLATDMVWAEITISALTGTALYGLVALIEKRVTFWHPSQRG